jgi:ABC-2 type transport system permease protein
MSSPSNAEPIDPQAGHSATLTPTRPFYWSVRRELWEYRSAYIAPLAVAGVVLFGFLIRILSLPHTVRASSTLPPMEAYFELARPYASAVASVAFAGLIVSVFYSLGALNNERRDRSILFWKSLPVSDLITVLSKAFIALIVLPVIVFAIATATTLLMLILGSAVVAANGVNPATLWAHWPMFKMSLVLVYVLAVTALWYAPIYGWLLFVSGWARRVPFLWAVLPPLGVCILEKIAFDTSHIASLLVYRLTGAFSEGFEMPAHGDKIKTIDPLAALAPIKFLSSLGLWSGLLIAVGFLAASIWLRRYREPS